MKRVKKLAFRRVDAETFLAAYNRRPEKTPICEFCGKPATHTIPTGGPGDGGYFWVCDSPECNLYSPGVKPS